jgi:ketosteroid isomerase-like protein
MSVAIIQSSGWVAGLKLSHVMSEVLEAFRTGYLATNARFNEHDFEGAFAVLAEDVEWHLMTDWATLTGVEIVRGRTEVIALFAGLLEEMPEWRTEPQEFIEVTERVFVVRTRVLGTGRASRAAVTQSYSEVFELAEDGTVIWVHQCADHDEALLTARARA